LTWESDPERPWNAVEGKDPRKDGSPETADADEIPFEDRKKALVMAILKPPIPLADLELTNLGEDITEENIADIEARAKA
jgi:hypothetical protein